MMDPDLATVFAEEFTAEWNRLAAERGQDNDQGRRDLAAVERKLANLVEAIADGLRSPGLQAKLSALEDERERLTRSITAPRPSPVRLMPNLGEAYRRQVGRLRDAMAAGDNPEARDAARALIDRVIIRPFMSIHPAKAHLPE